MKHLKLPDDILITNVAASEDGSKIYVFGVNQEFNYAFTWDGESESAINFTYAPKTPMTYTPRIA